MSSLFNKYSSVVFLFAIVIILLVLTDCKKKEDDPDENDTQTVYDQNLMEKEADQIWQAINRYVLDNGLDKTSEFFPNCMNASYDTTSQPKVITITFEENCQCNNWDGKTRSGTITATYTGKYRDDGTKITISTSDYLVDDVQFKYTKEITNHGKNSDGHSEFIIKANGQAQILDQGNEYSTINWSAHRKREWVSGENTIFNPFDDIYHLQDIDPTTGNNRYNVKYAAQIIQPIEIKLGCRWLVTKGILDVTPEGKQTRTIDYGNGTCDNKCTVSVGNWSTEFMFW